MKYGRILLFQEVNIMSVDTLVTDVAKASADMILIDFTKYEQLKAKRVNFQINPISVPLNGAVSVSRAF